jgi:hypothetical protein
MDLKGYDEWKTSPPKEWDDEEETAEALHQEVVDRLDDELPHQSLEGVLEYFDNGAKIADVADFLTIWNAYATDNLKESVYDYHYEQMEKEVKGEWDL